MSENQQPLDEEQAVSDVQEQETLPAAAEDTLPAAQDENAPAILDAEPEEEEEDIDPADVKIFGMKRILLPFLFPFLVLKFSIHYFTIILPINQVFYLIFPCFGY